MTDAVTLGLAWSLQIAVIAIAAEIGFLLIRGLHPQARSRFRAAAFILALVAPLAPAPQSRPDHPSWPGASLSVVATSVTRAAGTIPADGRTALLLAWSAVAAIRLIRVGRGVAELAAMSRGSAIARLAPEEHRVVQSALVSTPASSFWGGVILVPTSFFDQPEPWRRAVIAHETLHLRNRHGLALLFEETVLALFWFHPAMALLVSRARDAREEFVDAQTVALTGEQAEYREMLIALASKSHFLAPAVSGTTALTARIQSLIALEQKTMPNHRLTRSVLAGLALIGAATFAPARPAVEGGPKAAATDQKVAKPERQKISGPVSFPEALKEKRVSGVVLLEIVIDPEGNVTAARSVRADDNPDLVKAGLESVRQWKYSKGNQATMTVAINYRSK